MNNTQRATALTGALLAAILAGIFAYIRLTAVTPENDPVRYWRREGDRVFSQMHTVSVLDRERVLRVLQEAPTTDPRGLLVAHTAPRDELLGEVAAFISDRLEATSPQDYMNRRQARGYRQIAREEFERKYSSWNRWAQKIGLESDDPIEIMSALWKYEPSRRARISGICVGDDACFVSVGLSRKHEFIDEVPFGTLGYDLWHGGSAATCRVWTSPPTTRKQLVEKYGEVLAATVGIIADVPGSKRRPILFGAFWDPGTKRWWVDSVSVTNFIGRNGEWTCMEW